MPRAGLLPCLALLLVPVAVVVGGGCSSDPPPAGDEDAATDTIADTAPFEEPELEGGSGRVLLLRLYDPVKRCFQIPTEIGNFRDGPDGGPSCDPGEVCYERPDGILAYHKEDCIPDGRYRAAWTKSTYSDLGPCEPIKRLIDKFDVIKDCPNTSCTLARDVTVDTARGCATAIASKGCRSTFGAPTKCFCNGSLAFVPADPKSTTPAPTGFSACDATSEPCKTAIAQADTVKGCAGVVDAGADATADAPAEAATDAPTDGG